MPQFRAELRRRTMAEEHLPVHGRYEREESRDRQNGHLPEWPVQYGPRGRRDWGDEWLDTGPMLVAEGDSR